MNGKKAKALRKEAAKLTIGASDASYLVKRDNPKKLGTIKLDPKSTRGKYKQLKKAYKA